MKICPTCQLRYPDDNTVCFVDRATLVEAPDPWIGKLIAGRYRIDAKLGEGGMATVYRAHHSLHDKTVAIKLFRKEFARDATLRERFRREATSASRLAHPNIIEIPESGETDDGTPFLVMEFLAGESLESRLGKGVPPLDRTIDIMLQVLAGLARAHDFQVIHRDIKPDNLFLCRGPEGRDIVKILDFGIARSMADSRLTNSGEVFGTPQYMAPERITSIDAGPSADLYAIGVILFEMVTGELPFEAEDIAMYLMKHLREAPRKPSEIRPDVPPKLEQLIMQLLEKEPSKRPLDAHAVAKVLREIAQDVPRTQPTPEPDAHAQEAPKQEVIVETRRVSHTLAPATMERWERRMRIFEQMIARVYSANEVPPQLVEMMQRLRAVLAQTMHARNQSLTAQAQLEAIVVHGRDGQGRFGHAMDALGQDLSRLRQEIQQARAYEKHYADVARHSAGSLVQLHAQIAATAPVPTAELAQMFRNALTLIEHALPSANEAARAAGYVTSKEREITDVEFQIAELRTALERVSQQNENERAEVQKYIERVGAHLQQLEQALLSDAGQLAETFRGRADLEDLYRELESDSAPA